MVSSQGRRGIEVNRALLGYYGSNGELLAGGDWIWGGEEGSKEVFGDRMGINCPEDG
jgi:hypothetical protein